MPPKSDLASAPRRSRAESRGARRDEQVILGAAFSSGLQRRVIEFFSAGSPVEFELIRAIRAVAQPHKKTIGVVQTDLFPMGQKVWNAEDRRYVYIPALAAVQELAKQYNVELVQAQTKIPLWLEDETGQPTGRRYAALLIIQPSQMAPVELENVIAAIKSGQPTAILEDPLVFNVRSRNPYGVFQGQPLSGTTFPRQYSRVSSDSAYIENLWDALGIDVTMEKYRMQDGTSQKFPWVIWKQANTVYPKSRALDQKELYVVRNDTEKQFDEKDPAMRGIHELYFPFVGQLARKKGADTEFQPLVRSGTAGKISVYNLLTSQSGNDLERNRGLADADYVFAARITQGDPAQETTPGKDSPMNVVYVSDVDFIGDCVYYLHDNPAVGGTIDYAFDNVSFFGNIIDSLAGESDFLTIRSRRIVHATLKYVEQTTERALQKVYEKEEELEKKYEKDMIDIDQEVAKVIDPLKKSIANLTERQAKGESINQAELNAKTKLLNQSQLEQQAKEQHKVEQLQNELNEGKRTIRLDAELEIQKIQRSFKLAAVTLPVIPPLLLGVMVFARRRLREREGISKARRLK